MSMDGLLEAAHEPVFVPHLLLAGLQHSKDSPCVYLGERVLTGREVSEQISCYAQAFATVGLTQGSRIAMLSPNRPEVLFAMGANMVTGCRTSALHPLGSLDDHAYVIEDAEIETLVFDPSFAERAAALRERVPDAAHRALVRAGRGRHRPHRAGRRVSPPASSSSRPSTRTTSPASPTPAARPASPRA